MIKVSNISLFFWAGLFFTVGVAVPKTWARGHSPQVDTLARNYRTPTKKLRPHHHPDFVDDLKFELLEKAINRQLKRYNSKNLSGKIYLGGIAYPQTQAVKSLEVLKQLSQKTKACLEKASHPIFEETCFNSFNWQITKKFDVFVPDLRRGDPRYGEKNSTFFTGYFTPVLKGMSKWSPDFPWAVYKKPSKRELSSSTRAEIDFGNVLRGKNLELFYTHDLFEVYMLQVEGGGKVEFLDSTKASYLSYAGTNGKSWRFISKYMRKKGMIKSGSIAAQREYLKAHPEHAEQIFSSCPSYVYFKLSKDQPEGSDVTPLTNRRSIATDSKLYGFKGLIAFVETQRPREGGEKYKWGDKSVPYQSFSRFFLDQDTGGAIKGKGRVDLYFGEGDYAKFGASNQQSLGNIYFLMLKK